MKRVLITGANSYIGKSFEKYVKEHYVNEFIIDALDMKNPDWVKHDFRNYDSVFHVAGIAHADVGNVNEETKQLYYQVNCNLAYQTALKAKESGIKQFIYMSSIIVYGECAPYGKTKIITRDTNPVPSNFYGDSKLQAELKLSSLQSNSFNIALVRPPMIYGPESKGNYQTLSKLAKKLPIFPNIKNQRSMLFVYNLTEFIKQLIDNCDNGIYYPQNDEYVSTSNIVRTINPDIKILGVLNIGIIIGSRLPGKISRLCNKAFGNLVYDKSMSVYHDKYCRYSFNQSIKKTEVIR